MTKAAISLIHQKDYKSGRPNRTRAAMALILPEEWQERMYRFQELMQACAELPPGARDVFFSLNGFGFRRRMEHLAQLNALFVDLDPRPSFKLPNRQAMLGLVRQLVPKVIPEPNFLVCSGRGFWLIWLLEPTPAKALPLWIEIEDYLVHALADLGADPKARDATRVMRVPGTINGKTGQVVDFGEPLHLGRSRLDQLADEGYLRQLKLPLFEKGQEPARSKPRQETPVHHKFFSLYSLHQTILQDLMRLADQRGRQLQGCRQYFLFIWRNCLVRLCQTPEVSEYHLRAVALQYLGDDQLPPKEWRRTTMSAYRAKHKTVQGDEAQGYTLRVSWIIDRLSITPEEQRDMQVLIGTEEKYRRKNERRNKLRRHEYLEQVAEKRLRVQSIYAENPEASIRKLAELSDVPKSSVHRYLSDN